MDPAPQAEVLQAAAVVASMRTAYGAMEATSTFAQLFRPMSSSGPHRAKAA